MLILLYLIVDYKKLIINLNPIYKFRMKLNNLQDHVTLTKHKSTIFIFLVCINASLSAFYVGYALVYISTFQDFQTIIQIYDIKFGGKDVTEGVITGCVPIGAMIGALLSSVLLKKLSRRNCFLFTNFIGLIALVVCFIKVGPMIIVGRIIIGICTGVFSAIVPLYINQIVPLQLKNFGTFNQVFIASAQSFAFLLYYLMTEPFEISDQTTYYWTSNVFLVTMVIQTIVFLFIFPYETPKYWLEKREHEKCKELLRVIYEEEWVQEAYNQLLATQQKTPQQELQEGQVEHANSLSSRTSSLQIKNETPMPKIAIFLAIHVALFQQLTGINTIALYGGKIVKEVLPDLNKIIPIFTTLLPALTAAFTTELMKKYGRKTLLQFGDVLLIFALVLMCIGFAVEPHTQSQAPKILIVIALFFYMGSFGLTLGPIVWLMIPEFVQPRIIPYSTMTNLTGAALCVILSPIASSQLPNKAYLFAFFLLWGVGSFIVNQKFLVQTKDKTRQQIYRQLKQVQTKSELI